MGVCFLLGALNLALGSGLQGLRSWARWTEIVFLVGLLLSLVGGAIVSASVAIMEPNWLGVLVMIVLGYGLLGLIPAYVLSLLLGRKGRMVFSPEYGDVIERTPHIRYRTSRALLIVLGVIVLLLTMAMVVGIVIGRAS
jgi:hypothetical protein